MHYVAWVVADNEDVLDAVLDPYNENKHETAPCSCEEVSCRDDGEPCLSNPNGHWDWFVIGGRWDNIFGGKNKFTAEEALKGIEQGWGEEGYPIPYTFVAGEMWMPEEKWYWKNSDDHGFIKTQNFKDKVIGFLNQLRPNQNIYVVDYHS